MHPADGRVVSNFLVQALQNQPITVYGRGLQTRSFCYVDDMVEALVKLMQLPDSFTGPINLGNPEEFTILDLVACILELTGSSSEIVYLPLPADDPRQRRPDISLARQVLRWLPTTRLREGLALTAVYFENLLGRTLRDGVLHQEWKSGTASNPALLECIEKGFSPPRHQGHQENIY
jgi:UDP-glucuronate decarboxylase